MTIRGNAYKDLFLSCVQEGYDHAHNVLNYGGNYKCPYEKFEHDTYEYDAWWIGVEWYRARVH